MSEKLSRPGWAILALTLTVGLAQAAFSRLDNANAHLVKAHALLKAAAHGGETSQAAAHRKRAIRLIEQAEREIERAKRAAGGSQGSTPGAHTLPNRSPNAMPGLR